MTPEMIRAVQTKSELGAYAAANLANAYDLFKEFWEVAVAASNDSTHLELQQAKEVIVLMQQQYAEDGKTIAELKAKLEEASKVASVPDWLDTTRFLTDVTTSAGLLAHGKRDKGLAKRIGDFAHTYRQLAAAPEAPAQHLDTGKDAELFTKVSPITRLPDGSAFFTASYPLPPDHWLYAELEYALGADEPNELPEPILTHQQRETVIAAIRYAVRAATMCGKEADCDLDALVQNAVYALCGPFTKAIAAEKDKQ